MNPEPFVTVDIRHALGTLRLDAKFAVTAPWTVLFGPSGSGKSTILRAISGLVQPHKGVVSVLGQIVSRPGYSVPAHLRRVRWAGQRAALFPRKTVRENVLAGFHQGRGGKETSVDAVLEHFGLLQLADRRPAELSGGQRQLVSAARAAAGARGRILLLDEPFAGLDAGVRDRLIGALREWMGGGPVISVTHDVGEAFQLGAEVIRVSEGRVIAQGPVGVVLAEERERLRGVLG